MIDKRKLLIEYIENLSDMEVNNFYDNLTDNNNNIYKILLPLATYLNHTYTDNELAKMSESISKSFR